MVLRLISTWKLPHAFIKLAVSGKLFNQKQFVQRSDMLYNRKSALGCLNIALLRVIIHEVCKDVDPMRKALTFDPCGASHIDLDLVSEVNKCTATKLPLKSHSLRTHPKMQQNIMHFTFQRSRATNVCTSVMELLIVYS
jgi:hypothetical protein